MRVITGKYKGRKFRVSQGFHGRPTTDFAKENLFNVLRALVDFNNLSAIDLFAGTGSISLELLSRGCSRVVSVERDERNFRSLLRLKQDLQDPAWHLVLSDALRIIANPNSSFGLVFADPPYSLPQLPQLPDMILQSTLLERSGLLVLEHGKETQFSSHPALQDHRTYGAVNFSFFSKPL